MKLEFTYLGTHWPWSGDMFSMKHPNGNQATVYVDSIGETWVSIRRIPEGGYFHTERVEAWRAFNGAEKAAEVLKEQGYGEKRNAPFAHRVRERQL